MKTLTHNQELFSVVVDNKDATAILKEINEAGLKLGKESLRLLLKGEKTKAGDFEMTDDGVESVADVIANAAKAEHPEAPPATKMDVELKPIKAEKTTPKFTPEARAAKKAADDEAKKTKIAAAAAKKAATKAPETEAPNPMAGFKTLAELEAEKGNKTSAPVVSATTKKYGHPEHPVMPQPITKGSLTDQVWMMLTRPEGASKQEIVDAFGWDKKRAAYGVPNCDILAKGYCLATENVDGEIRMHLNFIGGAGKVAPDQILYREKKAVEPKAPKEPKEVKAPRVKIAKSDLANVPAMPAQMTRRTAKAKQ